MMTVALSMIKMMTFGWLALLFFSLAVLCRRPDTHVEIWAGASALLPWTSAAKAIQWRRQRTGERKLDRIVDFHRALKDGE